MHRLKYHKDVLKACLENLRRSIKRVDSGRDIVGADHEGALA